MRGLPSAAPPYHPGVIPIGPNVPGSPTAPLRLRRLADRIAAARAIDAAEAFRDLPGLALLESARPGRNARWTYLTADPVAVLEAPAAGPDPFAVARRLLARLDPTPVVPADAPPFLGGLVGFLGYDLGHVLERLPSVELRQSFIDRVTELAAGEPVPFTLDYWRLNISARKP